MSKRITKKQAAVMAAMAADTELKTDVDPALLARAITAARELWAIQRQVQAAAQVLEELRAKERTMQVETLPAIMGELGQDELPLSAEMRLVVAEGFECSIPTERGVERIKDLDERVKAADRRSRALKWLADNKFAAIIKTEVTAMFGKGEEAIARKLVTMAKKQFNRTLHLERSVHPSTLKAFLKEQMEEGRKDIPMDAFGVHTYKVARLEPIGRKKQDGREED